MSEIKYGFSIYRDGTVLEGGREEESHIKGEYKLIKDEIDDNGLRHIILKKKDRAEFNKKLKEVVDALMIKLNEKSKLFRGVLTDALIDYTDESINRLHKKVVLGKTPVKAAEGCFKIIIGDGRRKNSEEIMIRN